MALLENKVTDIVENRNDTIIRDNATTIYDDTVNND
jgi:hypothetical protein